MTMNNDTKIASTYEHELSTISNITSENGTKEDNKDENKNKNSNTHSKVETIKETVTDSKFVMGAGTGFVAGALTGGFLTHAYEKKKQKTEEKKRITGEEKEYQRILELRRAREEEELNYRRQRQEREYREGNYEEDRRRRGRRGHRRRHSQRGIHPGVAALGGFVAGEMISGGGERIGHILRGGFDGGSSGLW